MKNNFFICAALAAALTTASCDKEESGAGTSLPGEGQKVSLSFENAAVTDGNTRAFGAGTTEAWEKSISSATVLVFNAEGDIKFRRLDLGDYQCSDESRLARSPRHPCR